MTGQGTILVVDDDSLTCELAQAILTAQGFHVLTATTGAEGVALFRQHAEAIRAVLLDLWMPGMSGKAVGQEIYRMHPGTRIILLTGVTKELAVASLAGLPMAGLLQKPFSSAKLLAKVREVVED